MTGGKLGILSYPIFTLDFSVLNFGLMVHFYRESGKEYLSRVRWNGKEYLSRVRCGSIKFEEVRKSRTTLNSRKVLLYSSSKRFGRVEPLRTLAKYSEVSSSNYCTA